MAESDKQVLDVDFIIRRRLELGMNRRTLSHRAGVTDRTMLSIERGESHLSLPLEKLVALAQALAVEPGQLFLRRSAPNSAQPDDIRVEAALLSIRRQIRARDIRVALNLTPATWATSIERLRTRLERTGAALVASTDGLCRVVAREGVLTQTEREALTRPTRARSDLTLQQARMLKRIIDGDSGAGRLTTQATTSELIALGYLERNAFIERDSNNQYRLTGETAFSFGLLDLPPRRKARS